MSTIFEEKGRTVTKQQAKELLAYANYKVRHTQTKRLEIALTIKEMP